MLNTHPLDDPKVRALIADFLPPDDGEAYVTVHIPFRTAIELAKYRDCYAPLLKEVAQLVSDELD